jgi:hypothetical protein
MTMNARQRWLLSEVSSAGRTKIDVAQYEELRKLANEQAAELTKLGGTVKFLSEERESLSTHGSWAEDD